MLNVIIVVVENECGINLTEYVKLIKFENIYIQSNSLYLSKYNYSEKLLRPLKIIGYYIFSSSENIVYPSEEKNIDEVA